MIQKSGIDYKGRKTSEYWTTWNCLAMVREDIGLIIGQYYFTNKKKFNNLLDFDHHSKTIFDYHQIITGLFILFSYLSMIIQAIKCFGAVLLWLCTKQNNIPMLAYSATIHKSKYKLKNCRVRKK